MIETTVESIRVSLVTQHRVVILKEVDGERHLPIWIGAYEAEAIAMELQGVTPTRPLPYDLMRTILGDLGATVERIIIADLSQEVFFARVIVDHNGRTHEIDSRPSDAIALAVRTGARIMVEDGVIERAGVTLNGDEEEGQFAASGERSELGGRSREGGETRGADDERLSVFRDFINSLDLDDFDRKRSS